MPAGATARGLGKLLVVAPDQAAARTYLDTLRGWMPAEQAKRGICLATSSQRDAHKALAAFRLLPEPSILVTVAMAYEGLDAPRGRGGGGLDPHPLAALARADDRAGDARRPERRTLRGPACLGVPPGRPAVRIVPATVETEQGTLAKRPEAARQGSLLPDWLLDQLAERGPQEAGIVPLASNALGLRYATLRPGPSFAAARPENEGSQTELLDPPSVVERRLRLRIGEMVAAQTVKDDAGLGAQRGQGRYHGYNAVLKRAMGGKSRAEMTLSELEAAVSWLERNRPSDHLHLLDGDMRYTWSARQRVRPFARSR